MSKRRAPSRGGRGARQRILDAAAELFYRDGIIATGVERLAAQSSVSKRTLYQHFPSKTAVVEGYLRTTQHSLGKPGKTGARSPDRAPRERLLSVFDIPDPRGAPVRGCPF